MFEIELTDSTRTITFETDVAVDVLNQRTTAFVAAVDTLHAAVPLLTFEGKRTVGNPLIYDYTFVTQDGRTWNQSISFVAGVRMTFNVPDDWRLDEFVPHRAVRDEFILLVRDYGLEKVKVTYGIAP